MVKVCKGGFLDGMPISTQEDTNRCINEGGYIVDTDEEISSPQAPEGPVVALTYMYPSAAVVETGQPLAELFSWHDYARAIDSVDIDFAAINNFSEASEAIEAKAAILESLAGSPQGPTVSVPGGYMRSYQGCDIYYSKAGGAHEVHGEIRAKYNILHGVLVLGLPITDEEMTPDQNGRYNHFNKGASIYWTPTTGAMMVRGEIRNLWASQGWERGQMGYPVADEYQLPVLSPQDTPDVAWSLFQNGAIVRKGNDVDIAKPANLLPNDLMKVTRTFFDRALKQHNPKIGLKPKVDLVEVSDWSYGFWKSSPRTITYRLYGFYKYNDIIPDMDFEIVIRLRFAFAWTTTNFLYPGTKTLITAVDWLDVRAWGILGSEEQLARDLYNGIWQTFYRGGPDPQHPEVPDGAIFVYEIPTGARQTGSGNIDVIDLLTTAQGGLQVLVNPLPHWPPVDLGEVRQNAAQRQIDVFVENY